VSTVASAVTVWCDGFGSLRLSSHSRSTDRVACHQGVAEKRFKRNSADGVAVASSNVLSYEMVLVRQSNPGVDAAEGRPSAGIFSSLAYHSVPISLVRLVVRQFRVRPGLRDAIRTRGSQCQQSLSGGLPLLPWKRWRID
jgi:hypothetical protein